MPLQLNVFAMGPQVIRVEVINAMNTGYCLEAHDSSIYNLSEFFTGSAIHLTHYRNVCHVSKNSLVFENQVRSQPIGSGRSSRFRPVEQAGYVETPFLKTAK